MSKYTTSHYHMHRHDSRHHNDDVMLTRIPPSAASDEWDMATILYQSSERREEAQLPEHPTALRATTPSHRVVCVCFLDT